MLRASVQAKMLGKAMIVMAEVPGFGRMDQSTATQAVSRSCSLGENPAGGTRPKTGSHRPVSGYTRRPGGRAQQSSNHRAPPLVGRIRYLRSSGAPPPRLGESGREQGTTFIDKQGTLRPSPLLAEIRSTTLVLARCLGGIQMNPGPAAKNLATHDQRR
jgi:hypothetical protein